MFAELRFEISLQNHILFERIVEDKSVFVSVLGDMAHARFTSVSYRGVGNIFAAKQYFARLDFFKPRYAVNEFGLTVPVYTGNADYFARTDVKRNAAHGVFFMNSAFNVQIFNFEYDLLRGGGRFVDRKLYVSADHHFGKLLFSCIFNVYRTYVLALSENSASVGDSHYLV